MAWLPTSQSRRSLAERGRSYSAIALICALSNYVIMVGVELAGGHYLLGTIISFSIVTPTAYLLHSRFTFAEPMSWRAFARFVAAIAATYPAALAMLAILCTGFGLSVAIAIPIATVILFLWNFVAAHWAILPPPVPSQIERAAGQPAAGNKPC